MIIKLLLVAGLAAAAVLLLRGKRTAFGLLMRRSMALGAILLGIVAVLLPSLVTEAARTVGVGRGTDLVLYLLCVTFLFVTIVQNLRLAELRDRTVELARRQALLEAELHEPDQLRSA